MKISDGIENVIATSIKKALKNNSEDTYMELRFFIIQVWGLSVANRSLDHLVKYAFLPLATYRASKEEAQKNLSIGPLQEKISDLLISDLTALINDIIGSELQKDSPIKTIKELNPFFYWAFYGYNALMYELIKEKDFKLLKNAIESISDLRSPLLDIHQMVKYDLLDYTVNLQGPERVERLIELKEKKRELSQFEAHKRRVLFITKSWLIYLFHRNRINKNETHEIINEIKMSNEDPNELLLDLIFFRKFQIQYMNLMMWDYKGRRAGNSNDTPPDPSGWLTMGFLADQIRENRLGYVNLNSLEQEELKQLGFIYDDLNSYGDIFLNKYEKWKPILKVKSEDDLREKIKNVLSVFALARKQNTKTTEEEIVEQPLSEEKISAFRQSIGKAWKEQARIHFLFRKFGNIEDVTTDDLVLKRVGQRTFFSKAKMMFIEGLHYSPIYGISQMGGQTGRWEDDAFFAKVMEDVPEVQGDTMLDTLENAIQSLNEAGTNPDMILMSAEYSYKDEKLLNSGRFITKRSVDSQAEQLPFLYLGHFDEIPVYSSFSNYLNGRVVVCDFKKSFKLLQRFNDAWFEKELTVEVHPVGETEAEDRYKTESQKWNKDQAGNDLTQPETLTLIKTSVTIDIWTLLDFQIVDSEGYRIGRIKQKLQD